MSSAFQQIYHYWLQIRGWIASGFCWRRNFVAFVGITMTLSHLPLSALSSAPTDFWRKVLES